MDGLRQAHSMAQCIGERPLLDDRATRRVRRLGRILVELRRTGTLVSVEVGSVRAAGLRPHVRAHPDPRFLRESPGAVSLTLGRSAYGALSGRRWTITEGVNPQSHGELPDFLGGSISQFELRA